MPATPARRHPAVVLGFFAAGGIGIAATAWAISMQPDDPYVGPAARWFAYGFLIALVLGVGIGAGAAWWSLRRLSR